MHKCMTTVAVAAVVLTCVSGVQANGAMETVPVGNLGNAGELSGDGPYAAIVGAVDYAYNIGKYEVTAGQYTEFLNAVADTNAYGLYSTYMADPAEWLFGCNIQRSGDSGSYTYSVDPDWANRPVNYVSWSDAARFSNWLHNGQGSGDTENGTYDLTATHPYYNPDGSIIDTPEAWDGVLAALRAVTREDGATWAIPTEDEWYKSAYHKNDGDTGNYFDYPTSSDTVPSDDLDGSGNNATFWDDGYTIGSPYYRTEFGAHANSASPYDTFDQAGNLFEWNEATFSPSSRGVRGGSFETNNMALHAVLRGYYSSYRPTHELYDIGFRVAEVPEPGTLTMLALGGLFVARRRR